MELSSEVLEGLQIAGDPNTIDDKSFEGLVQFAIESTINREDDLKAMGGHQFFKVDSASNKLALYGLVTLFVESTKHGVDVGVLQSVMEESRFSKEKIATVTRLYQESRPNIEDHLKSISFHLPHIVDVDWRLDYCIKSDKVEKIDKPVYLVTLTTESGDFNEPEKITLYCTLDQLQDLVSKLKDAVKCLERISQK